MADMKVRKYSVALTTDGSGDATGATWTDQAGNDKTEFSGFIVGYGLDIDESSSVPLTIVSGIGGDVLGGISTLTADAHAGLQTPTPVGNDTLTATITGGTVDSDSTVYIFVRE